MHGVLAAPAIERRTASVGLDAQAGPPPRRGAFPAAANVDGAWFCDTRCIDCGTCREIAPETFAPAGGHSVVSHQPAPGDGLVR